MPIFQALSCRVNNATPGAAGAAVAITVPPALSWCLSNPVACNRIAIAGGEIAAGDALGPTSLAVLGTASAVAALEYLQYKATRTGDFRHFRLGLDLPDPADGAASVLVAYEGIRRSWKAS